jgi:hypothetical protein
MQEIWYDIKLKSHVRHSWKQAAGLEQFSTASTMGDAQSCATGDVSD